MGAILGGERGKIRGQWVVLEEMLDITRLKLPPILYLFDTFF